MKKIFVMILLFVSGVFASTALIAQHKEKKVVVKKQKPHRTKTVVVKNNGTKKVVRPNARVRVRHTTYVTRYPRRSVVVVRPRAVRTVRVLPTGHTVIRYHRRPYYYHAGFWYVRYNNVYRVAPPAYGLRIRVLPVGYRRIVVGPTFYYYYGGVFYKKAENLKEYEVQDPPQGAVVPELPQEDVEEVQVEGQTYYEYDDILYKPIVTQQGVQYEVVGELHDDE